MPDFKTIQDLPDISFIDNKSVDDVRQEMVADFEAFITEATGKPFSLERADPHRMELYAAAAQIYQGFQYVDRAGKQNLLKYTYSDFLDNVAAFKGITRIPAEAATTTVRFTLSAVRDAATAIPQGTRVTNANGMIYFQTAEYAEIPAGAPSADVPAVCAVTGAGGNGFAAGELNTLVDQLPYMASVANITQTDGGAEVESDADLADRVYLAPSGYSTAGPEDAYLYRAKQYSANVGDVVVASDQEAGTVDLYFLMKDGSTPSEEALKGMEGALRDGNVRPMTDLVKAHPPGEVPYTINLTYYINQSDGNQAVAIQNAVQTAIENYTVWQRSIGRDVNPSKLVAIIMAAGAKRVELTAPAHIVVGKTNVAALSGDPQVRYGGLEDD